MQIPIENIYYLLCYAWDKLEEKDRVNVAVDDKTELVDLFAKILIKGARILLKRGIDKSYIDYTEEISGIKGKVQISETYKRNLLFKQKTICTFDTFSSDILINRILFSTLFTLSRTRGLNKDLKKEIISLLRMFHEIQLIELSNSCFRKIKLNRNNKFYGLLMDVCQIIHESILPSEEKGNYKFVDFTRDERKMNQLFEAFIRNFYRLEQDKYRTVKKEIINWQFEHDLVEVAQYIPNMETDITLENLTEKIIIDAKYYRETMTVNYEKEKIRSNNLYQLFSYLLNQENGTEKSNSAKGILIYPTIVKDYDLKYRYKNHPIEIRTVNLNCSWKEIEKRLKKIIEIV